MRLAPRLLAALATTTLLATPALAQRYTGIVAFGDSYADDGNLFRLLGETPPYPPPYPTGRFSGGINFVDVLQSTYGLSQTNYAIGGAETGTANVFSPLAPGFAQEWESFVAGGGTISSRDILAISIGGNDARAYEMGGGTVAGAATAAGVSVGQATAGLDALVKAGAKTIVWAAGDVGLLPEVSGNPVAAIGSAFSSAYNGRMQGVLSGIAGQGVTVAYVDLSRIAKEVQADPGRYGLVDATHTCPLACAVAAPIADQYLFYVDGVHPTSAGMTIIGRYAAAELNTPLAFRMQGDAPLVATQDFGRLLNARADMARGRATGGLSVFFAGNYAHGQEDADDESYGFRSNDMGVDGGVEYGVGPLSVGVAADYSHPHLDGDGDLARVHARSWQVGGYAGFDLGGLFAQGYASYGWHHLHLSRVGVVDDLTADPHARSYGLGGRAGWLAGLGPVKIGPVIGINYAHARIDGYTETGDPVLNATVSGQTARALTGSLGAELRASVPFVGLAPYLRLTADRDLEGDSRTLSYADGSAPTIVNSVTYRGDPKQTYGEAAAGADVPLAAGIAIDFDAGATFGRSAGNDQHVTAGLRVGF